MANPTDRLDLNRYGAGDSNWSHSDTVETVDELAIERGAIADRPTSGNYDDELYLATDQQILYRWNETATDWIVEGVGSETDPLPKIWTNEIDSNSLNTDDASIATQLEIPVYSDDANAPNDTHFFNDGDEILKYKDSAGTVHQSATDPHDNSQHSEPFLFNGANFDGLDTSELLNLLTVGTQSLENQDYTEAVVTAGSASGTITIDLAAANLHRVEAVGNVTIEFANVTSTPAGNSVTIYFEDGDGTGPHTISWPTSVVWSDGNVQNEIEANSNIEVALISDDGGVEFRARRSGRRFE